MAVAHQQQLRHLLEALNCQADNPVAAVVGCGTAARPCRRARALASDAGDEVARLSKAGSEAGNALWDMALQIGRRSLKALTEDEGAKAGKDQDKTRSAPKAKPVAKKSSRKKPASAGKGELASKSRLERQPKAHCGHCPLMIPPPLETFPHQIDRSKMTCQAVVEAPAGSRVKVYYDPESHRFRIGKFLPLGMVFPLDFASSPRLSRATETVDLLILPEASLPVGSIVDGQDPRHPRGHQYKPNKKPRRNDRVIARLIESRLFSKIERLEQLGQTFVDELSTFFATYKRLRGQTYR